MIWEFPNTGLLPSTVVNSPYNTKRPYSSPILVISCLKQMKWTRSVASKLPNYLDSTSIEFYIKAPHLK